MDRRSFIRGAVGAATAGTMTVLGAKASAAATARKRFVMQLNIGSIDGWASGFLQPRDAGVYPRGVFLRGEQADSWNPNVNLHHKAGNHVFSGYAASLAPIASDLCFCVANAQSASHPQARQIQNTGSAVASPMGNASWAMGLAHALAGAEGRKNKLLVYNDKELRLGPASRSPATSDVATIKATSSAEFLAYLKDHAFMLSPSMTGLQDAYLADLAAYRKANELDASASTILDVVASSLMKGIDIGDTAAIDATLQRTFSLDSLTALASESPEMAGFVGTVGYEKYFRLSGLLLATGAASGSAFYSNFGDHHGGGSTASAARQGRDLWLYLRAFWQWVKATGRQDDVLIIVTHEFSRTPYDLRTDDWKERYMNPGTFRGQPVTIPSPPTHHHPVAGVVLLGAGVPGGKRFGAVADGYTAVGSADGRGLPADLPALTTQQIVLTTMMRGFGDLFPRGPRDLRTYWRNFSDNAPAKVILDA